LYISGFTVVCPDFRFGESTEPKNKIFLPNVDKLKQDAILSIAQREGFRDSIEGKVDAVAHSKGAIDLILAATRKPENFRNLVLVAPLGLHERVPITKVPRAIKELREGDARDALDKGALMRERPELTSQILENDAFKNAYQHDKKRYKLEGPTAANVSILEHMVELRRLGIKIAVVTMIGDSMVPSSSQEGLLQKGVNIDDRLIIPGIHGSIKYDPQVSRLVAELLQRM
jgi:hypothetical protein